MANVDFKKSNNNKLITYSPVKISMFELVINHEISKFHPTVNKKVSQKIRPADEASITLLHIIAYLLLSSLPFALSISLNLMRYIK